MWSHLCALLLLGVGIAATKPCRVLSLSGGGSYGAFEAGTIFALGCNVMVVCFTGVLKRLVQANPDLGDHTLDASTH